MRSGSNKNLSVENLLLHRLESGYCLPPLSPVAARLIDLASEDSCSIHELARLIEQDPSLAVSLLKLANSAFYGNLQSVSTLPQAILRIGFKQLRVMALSLSLREALPVEKRGPFDYEGFWRISLYQALLARTLSQQVKTCDPEEAFVAALILEIGVLLLRALFLKREKKISLTTGFPLRNACFGKRNISISTIGGLERLPSGTGSFPKT